MKRLLFRLFPAVLAAGFAGCGTPLPHPLLPEETGPVRIGVVMPLSGHNREYGERTLNGIQLALEEVNNARGIDRRRVELEVRDNASSPEGASRALSELAASGVHGLILGYDTSEVGAVREEAGRLRIPAIVPLATDDDLTEGNPLLLRGCFTDSQQAHALAGYIWYWRKLMRLGIVVSLEPEAHYSRNIARETAQWFSQLGGQVVHTAEFRENDPDLRKTLVSLISYAPQAILVPVHTATAAKIVRMLRELGFHGLLIGPDSWDEESFLRNCGSDPGECAFTAFYSPENPSEENRAFREKFRKKYFHYPASCEAQGYDSMKILSASLGGADTIEKFQANARTIRNYSGASGVYTMKRDGGIDRTIYINTIRPAGPGRPFPTSRYSRGFTYSRLLDFEN